VDIRAAKNKSLIQTPTQFNHPNRPQNSPTNINTSSQTLLISQTGATVHHRNPYTDTKNGQIEAQNDWKKLAYDQLNTRS